jgi:hypothetical protein
MEIHRWGAHAPHAVDHILVGHDSPSCASWDEATGCLVLSVLNAPKPYDQRVFANLHKD